MANLVVCCDGTWNTPDQKENGLPAPTNVPRLFNALAAKDRNGEEQKKYYHPGVGTEGGWWSRLLGGGAGQGLDDNVKSAYQWLAYNYQAGDHIFLFGFSRGAYTVRSLSGMITCCGLLDISKLSPDEAWRQIDLAFECYRSKGARRLDAACKLHSGDQNNPAAPVPIFFIGVWDTVGALGIPDDMALLNLLDNLHDYTFHDTKLCNLVQHARHAVAIDEHRQSFMPTLWTVIDAKQDVKQIWFPGVHCDVGGGYLQTDLSDGALKWMIDEATAQGLEFQNVARQINPNAWGPAHDSLTGVFKALKSRPRSVPTLEVGADAFHPSATNRHATPPIAEGTYWPTKTLQVTDPPETIDIFARKHWNATGFYLEPGTYEFTASGQWVDGDIKSGPDGKPDDFHLGEIVRMAASGLGHVETLYQNLTKNKQADFWWTKREEQYPWFSLIGVIANGAPPSNDSPNGDTVFKIGSKHELVVEPGKAGYLYCFANDAWQAYGNNRGSVALTIKRTA